jgi:hypothetical protein
LRSTVSRTFEVVGGHRLCRPSSTERAGRAYQSMSASPLKRPDGLARAKCREGPQPDSCTAAKKLDRPELVIAALRAAGPVVEVRPLVTAVHHRGESVVRVHDGFDENQRVVRRGESILQVLNGFDDERSCPGVATEHLRQIGIGPVGDVVVGLGLPEIAAFDRVSTERLPVCSRVAEWSTAPVP